MKSPRHTSCEIASRTWSRCLSVLLLISQGACYTMASLEHLPTTAGKSRRFDYPIDTVANAVRKAIQKDNLRLMAEPRAADSQWTFFAEKPMSFHDYGSIVRILVRPDSASALASTVRVVTLRRGVFNVTAESDYSASLFHHMNGSLAVFAPGALAIVPGTRVRLYFRDARFADGILRSSVPETISIGDAAGGAPTTVALTAIKALYVELDPSEQRKRVQSQTMLGTLAGAAVGFAIGYTTVPLDECRSGEFCVTPDTRVLTGYLGSVVGSTIGMIIGRQTAIGSTAYKPVTLPRASHSSSGVLNRQRHLPR